MAEVALGACQKRSVPLANLDRDRLVERIAAALLDEFGDRLSSAVVHQLATDAVANLSDASVSNFVPILARRHARAAAALRARKSHSD